jgi:iron complex transport system ATP-binding protein
MLSIRGLSVGYGTRMVLSEIDLDVSAGEIVGLVGPNGCGKTTLLKAVTRVVPWQAGSVTIAGRPVEGTAAKDLARKVAVVPQEPLLPAGFSALEVVLMGRTPHLGFFEHEGPRDYERSRDALALTGAMELADRCVDELSGGERQNVIIARALAQEAPLLLLDEPTANLDLANQVSVASLLRRLSRDGGVAVLAAVHDLSLASLYCDRIALMAEGCILASGAPRKVLTRANLKRAYGIDPLILNLDALEGPLVLPLRQRADSG